MSDPTSKQTTTADGLGVFMRSWGEDMARHPSPTTVLPTMWWLIERNDLERRPMWMADALRPGDFCWSDDPQRAHKFPTRESAETACLGGHVDGPLRVTEHCYVSNVANGGR